MHVPNKGQSGADACRAHEAELERRAWRHLAYYRKRGVAVASQTSAWVCDCGGRRACICVTVRFVPYVAINGRMPVRVQAQFGEAGVR